MHVDKAEAVVAALRDRRVFAHVSHTGVGTAGVRIPLSDGREAIWDAADAIGLEAQILLDGDLVGYIPLVPGSLDFGLDEIVDYIAAHDYGPIADPG